MMMLSTTVSTKLMFLNSSICLRSKSTKGTASYFRLYRSSFSCRLRKRWVYFIKLSFFVCTLLKSTSLRYRFSILVLRSHSGKIGKLTVVCWLPMTTYTRPLCMRKNSIASNMPSDSDLERMYWSMSIFLPQHDVNILAQILPKSLQKLSTSIMDSLATRFLTASNRYSKKVSWRIFSNLKSTDSKQKPFSRRIPPSTFFLTDCL